MGFDGGSAASICAEDNKGDWCGARSGSGWAERRQGVESLYPAFAEVLGNWEEALLST